MQVKRLIEELKKCDPDAQVRMNDYRGYPVLFVLARTGDTKNVWLECEEDVDLYTELSEYFERAVNQGLDELDVYTELVEMGITYATVGKYLGEDKGKHMHDFCKEHGLI